MSNIGYGLTAYNMKQKLARCIQFGIANNKKPKGEGLYIELSDATDGLYYIYYKDDNVGAILRPDKKVILNDTRDFTHLYSNNVLKYLKNVTNDDYAPRGWVIIDHNKK